MNRSTDQPNILFIMDDQHRFDYLGYAGADFVRTPNLDRLAEQGVRFTHCCTNSPLCAPARISLATGLQPHRLGALDNQCYLPHGYDTYYQRLRDHGYRVGCVGKLDLAKPDHYNGRFGDRPSTFRWGFTHPEECEGKMHAARAEKAPLGPYTYFLQEEGLLAEFCQDYWGRAAKGFIRDASHDSVLPTYAFEDTYIGRRAAAWIERVPDDFPWHFFVSFVGPHDPFDPPTEYADRYRNARMPAPIDASTEGKPNWIENRRLGMGLAEVEATRRQYCALIELIDDQVGLILDALESRGWLENTYIVFASDHGEMLGDHGLYQKSVFYEPALRVPLVVAGPGIQGGRMADALIELSDLNPTICELAGLPPQPNIDARSFAPLLWNDVPGHRSSTLSALHNARCLRTDRYKYIQNYNDLDELYDLHEDPAENHNLAPQHPDLARELAVHMRQRGMEGKWSR